MDHVNFFKNNEKFGFKEYLSTTHSEYSKTQLNSLRTILSHYADDIRSCIKRADPKEKVKLGRLMASSTVKLRDILVDNQSNEDENSNTIISVTITGTQAQNIVIGLTNNVSSLNESPLGKPQIEINKEPVIEGSNKRQRKKVVHDNFVNSEVISNDSGVREHYMHQKIS
ncbi:hypothetical protein RMATCC62417_04125 [Rhizopus microsporus]|nr:hypothetical protein RMATCC62417_04125 [Rhizopus microsporus]